MGTNYYLMLRRRQHCPSCGAQVASELDRLHVGKSSGGWAFALRQDPDLGLWDWSDYRRLFETFPPGDAWFEDEYSEVFNADQVQAVVFREDRAAPENGEWRRMTHAEGAVGRHSSRPVDYVQGEFC